MSKHTWVQENLASYVAGGLDGAERERLEQHATECPECAAALEEAQAVDRQLVAVFAGVQPQPALEDRLIHHLRQQTPVRRRRLGRVFKFIGAAAAVLLMAAVGAAVNSAVEQGELPFPGAVVQNHLKQIGIALYDADGPNVAFWFDDNGSMAATDEMIRNENTIEQFPSALFGKAKARDFSPSNFVAGLTPANTFTPDLDVESLARDIRKKSVLSVNGTTYEGTPVPQSEAASPPQNAPPPQGFGQSGQGGFGYSSGIATGGEAAEAKPDDRRQAQPSGEAGIHAAEPIPGTKPPAASGNRIMFAPVFVNPQMQWGVPSSSLTSPAPTAQHGDESAKRATELHRSGSGKGLRGASQEYYFRPADGLTLGGTKAEDDLLKLQDSKSTRLGMDGERKGGVAAGQPGHEEFAQAEKGKQDAPPKAPEQSPDLAPQRKIIRSGDIEFEVKSFDDAVGAVSTLVRSSKGGFIATINSEKLPNGKVRGSVVVRMPPEELDDFVMNLRKKLSEDGELKGQRIGSQDITKQYTDLESRLRAARTMEERLLSIIKDGKGAIKDLLMAEKELGEWRTKIETIEGELRYYSNLVNLSTLTIIVYEKEIRTAAVITENERIQAGIEVEDVEKSMREALDAVLKANGRVTRSELKQQAAGQFNAILHFEVAPESAGEVRDRLKQLGNMVRLEIDRVQQTEHGQPAPRDGKIKRGDTQFFVSLYNLANVAPRETVSMRIAVDNVADAYQKLLKAAGDVKARVANVQLNVHNPQNVTAQIDFDVRRTDETAVLAAIKAAGEPLSRHVNQQPEGENVTNAKIGYRIELVNMVNVPARETVTIRLATKNVATAHETLHTAIDKVKGHVSIDQLNVQDQQNVTAQIEVAVRRGDEAELKKAIDEAGETVSRQVARQPESDNVIDTKVAYRLELVNVINIPARETITLRVAATSVSNAYDQLRNAVTQANGRIVNAQLNAQDQQNVTAQVDFDLDRSVDEAARKAIKDAGEVLSRQVNRQPEGQNVTDMRVAYRVELINAAAIPPRESVTLGIEVADVEATQATFAGYVGDADGRVVSSELGQERNGRITAHIVYDVPLAKKTELVEAFRKAGQVRVQQVSRNPQAPDSQLALARLDVHLSNGEVLLPRDEGLWAQIRNGLSVSLRGLTLSASWLIVGVLFVLPWLLLLWGAIWLARKLWRGGTTETTTVQP